MKWQYGITTVPSRMSNELPRTIASLRCAGFHSPRLFVDGTNAPQEYETRFDLKVSSRGDAIKTVGNWILALWELYIREPYADRYVLFQDDIVSSKNLKEYLETCPFPSKSYFNFYTHPSNYALYNVARDKMSLCPNSCWYKSNQLGRGALGLMFDNQGVRDLLTHPNTINKVRWPLHPETGQRVGQNKPEIIKGVKYQDLSWRNLDGMVIQTLAVELGYTEWVHDPSLIQHTGEVSSIGSEYNRYAPNFRGEVFDLLSLVNS